MNMKKIAIGGMLTLLLTQSMTYATTYQSVEITADKLNVRESTDLDSKILGQLDENTLVSTSLLDDGWFQIDYAGEDAYISSDYAEVVKDYGVGYIVGDNVNVRNEPSTDDSQVITRLSNTEVNIYAEDDNWFKITTPDGDNGYVYGDFISLDKEALAQSQAASKLISIAKSKLGSPYKWGAAGPNRFDCSGFVRYCYQQAYGIDLPHSSSLLSKQGTTISKNDLQAGDIVFFTTNRSGSVNHAGIYIGNGQFIQASSSSSNGKKVCISSLDSGFYSEVFKWGKRIID